MNFNSLSKPACHAYVPRFLIHALAVMLLITPMTIWTPQAGAQSDSRSNEVRDLASRLVDMNIPGVEPDMSLEDLVDIGIDLARFRKLDEAERVLSEVIAIDRKNLRALRTAAQVYELRSAQTRSDPLAANAAADARQYLNMAIRVYLEQAIPLAIDMNYLRAAGEMYKTVLTHDPTNGRAQLGLARVLADMGQILLAIEMYELYVNPSSNFGGDQDSVAHLELGKLYLGRRSLHNAIRVLERARKLNPEDAQILVELAYAYLHNNDRERAKEIARQAAVIKAPDNPACRNVYATILLELSRVALDPKGSYRQTRENLQAAEEQAREAMRLGERRVEQAPGERAKLEELQRYYQTFTMVMQAKMEDDPDRSVEVRLATAEVFRKQAELARRLKLHDALKVIAGGGDRAGKSLGYLELRADLELSVEKYGEAADTCRAILAIAPENEVANRIIAQLPDDLRASVAPAEGAPSTPVGSADAR